MPPWQPVEGHGKFADERRLTRDQRNIVSSWAKQGSVQGNIADLPPTPQFPDGWQLGEPNLIVELPQTYVLAAEGRDVYRNFAIPIPVSSRRYVQAMELRLGNRIPVHHAFMLIDSTDSSRRLQAEDPDPGYSGMDGKLREAIGLYEEILRVHPERSDVRQNLNMARDLMMR